MAQAPNHECLICGEEYYACDSCMQERNITPWRVLTDTQKHFLVYTTIEAYNRGITTKAEAKKELELYGYNLKNINEFLPHVEKIAKEILTDDKKVNKK